MITMRTLLLSLLFFVFLLPHAHAQPKPPAAPSPPQSGVGYATVAAALAALQKKPGAQVEVKEGWTIVTEEAIQTIWSFTPKVHPAYPAVVKRAAVQDGH